MSRIYNFSAGPSMLPLSVLEKAAADLVDYQGSGMSVMEMSHRSPVFEDIIARSQSSLRRCMNISDDYEVLYMHGGATMQFSAVPLNLLPAGGRADYVQTGVFATKAAEEAKKYGTIHIVASSKSDNYNRIPSVTPDMLTPGASYVHITTNNTIFGTAYHQIPETGSVPLVADMSSNILGQAYDVSKFGLIYAGAQKNMGPAGLAVVIARKSLLGGFRSDGPVLLDYALAAKNDSMYNTPPCWAIYVSGLVCDWVLEMGGVAQLEKINRYKAGLLYDVIDNSKLYQGSAAPAHRSIMNVTFTLPTQELTREFLAGASASGLVNLKGHRAVGGVRASIYNAMPVEGAEALTRYMKEFEVNHP